MLVCKNRYYLSRQIEGNENRISRKCIREAQLYMRY